MLVYVLVGLFGVFMHVVCFGIQIDELLLKTPEEKNILEDRKETWAMMADNGFQGAQNRFSAVLPAKKPRNGNLTRAQEIKNENCQSQNIGRELLW